jgi:hypothetical protein
LTSLANITAVTASDIRGTALIVLGVILILVFSSINHGLDQNLGITRLNSLWTRGSWLAWFPLLLIFTFLTFWVSHLLASLLKSRASLSPLPSPTIGLQARPKPVNPVVGFVKKGWKGWKRVEGRVLDRMEKMFQRTDDARLLWLQGIGWAVTGGSLAGLCLVFTKAVVKISGLPAHPVSETIYPAERM